MKTERRQELRTNDLSEQIEQIGDYVRKNSIALTAIVLAAAIVFGGYFWYRSHQRAKVDAGWATLSRLSREPTDAVVISQIEAVANEDLAPSLTTEALLLIGETAMRKMTPTAGVAALSPEDVAAWAARAKTAFEGVIRRFPGETIAVGTAMIQLGVLHENQSDMAAAREVYERLRGDERFQHTPYKELAELRLARLDQLASPVVFPPPEKAAGSARPGALPMSSKGLPPEAAARRPDTEPASADQPPAEAATDRPGASPPVAVDTPATPDAPTPESPGEPPSPNPPPPAGGSPTGP